MTILICQDSDGNDVVYRTNAKHVTPDMFGVLSDLLPANVVAVGASPQASQFPDADKLLIRGLIQSYQNPNHTLPAEARDLRYLLPTYDPHTPLIAALLDLAGERYQQPADDQRQDQQPDRQLDQRHTARPCRCPRRPPAPAGRSVQWPPCTAVTVPVGTRICAGTAPAASDCAADSACPSR